MELWTIGFLFTFALVLEDEEPVWKSLLAMLLVLVSWPVVLGVYVKEIVDER